jgi:hypothetical protein
MHTEPHSRAQPAGTDYSLWSIEELRQLAAQMRVAGARGKSRRELIDLFAPPKTAQRRSRQHPADKELS